MISAAIEIASVALNTAQALTGVLSSTGGMDMLDKSARFSNEMLIATRTAPSSPLYSSYANLTAPQITPTDTLKQQEKDWVSVNKPTPLFDTNENSKKTHMHSYGPSIIGPDKYGPGEWEE